MVASGEALLQQNDELLRVYERTGDEQAFARIVEAYRGMVFGVCVRVMRNTHDAEDAAQAVFLTLAMQARGGNNIRALGPWLQQVAQRVSLDMYKSRKRRQAREDIRRQQTHDQVDSEESRQLDQHELRETLRLQLNELPAKYRLPMILYYFGGLTPEAIAKELGCKKKTLGVRLFRARKLLAEQLASRGVVACGAPLLLALREVVQAGLLQSLPMSGSQYAGMGTATGIGLGFDHLSGTLAAMAKALTRFAIGSKWRLPLVLLVAAGSGMAGSAGIIREFARFRSWKLVAPRLERLDELLQTLPRFLCPQILADGSQAVPRSNAPATPPQILAGSQTPVVEAARPTTVYNPIPMQTTMPVAQARVAPSSMASRVPMSLPTMRPRSLPRPLPPPVERQHQSPPVVTSLVGRENSCEKYAKFQQVVLSVEVDFLAQTTPQPPTANDATVVAELAQDPTALDSKSLAIDFSKLNGALLFSDGGSVRSSFDNAGIILNSGGVPIPMDRLAITTSTEGFIPEPGIISLLAVGGSLLLPRRRGCQ